MLPWILCGILAVIVIVLAVKIRIVQKSMDEICDCISEHLCSDTNQLVTVSSSDRHVRHLASEIAKQLSALRRQQRQYINGDRELKEAVTNISHDLRTPLTAICGYLELLEAEEMTDNTRRYVEQIRNRTEALKALTEELFRYSVVSSVSDLNYEKINVARALEDTLISFYGAFEQKNITPQISLPDSAVFRSLDKSALSRILGRAVDAGMNGESLRAAHGGGLSAEGSQPVDGASCGGCRRWLLAVGYGCMCCRLCGACSGGRCRSTAHRRPRRDRLGAWP